MPVKNPNSAYTQALKEARAAGYAMTREQVTNLKRGFEAAIKDLVRDRSDNPLVRARQDELRKELRAMVKQLETLITTTTRDGVNTTLREIASIHSSVTTALVRSVAGKEAAQQIARKFARIPLRAVASMNAKREGAATFKTLIERSMLDAAPELDVMLTRAVAQGMSPARLTNDIADLLAGDTPLGLEDYGLDERDISGIKTLYSDARRIAVTETNNALREGNRISMIESPVMAATWQRSGRHAALRRKEDRCDTLANQDKYGLGEGMYPVENWPDAPHPYCACTQGGPIQYMDVETWLGMQGIEGEEDDE